MKHERSVVAWRMVSVGDVAEDDLLVGDDAGQPDRVDRYVAVHHLGVRGGGAGRGVRLRGVVESTISAFCMTREASPANFIISTAPMAKLGAKNALASDDAAASRRPSKVLKPEVPITTRTLALQGGTGRRRAPCRAA